MERSCLRVLWIVLCWIPRWAMGAEMILSQPMVIDPPENTGISEKFPESRFGEPPSRPKSNRSARFISNAFEELRQNERGNEPNSGEGLVSRRRPAGLEFSQSVGRMGKVDSKPVIPEPGMPQSPANLNPAPETSSLRTGVQEVAVIAGDLGYFPKRISVIQDIPVRMFVTASSKGSLCIMMDLDGFQVRKQVKSQKIEELDFTPTRAGQFRYYCPVNGMEGQLIVKERPSSLMKAAKPVEVQ